MNLVAKKGDRFKCNVCGVVCVVDEICGCTTCDLICCEEPMKKTGKKKTAVKKKATKKKKK